MLAQHSGDAVRSVTEVSMLVRLENVLVSYVRYIGKAFWPAHLAPLYPRPNSPGLPWWKRLGGAASFTVRARTICWRDRRYLAVGWFWFLGTLVPMIGIITVGEQAMADRYAYIPYIGLFVIIAWTLDAFAAERRISDRWQRCSRCNGAAPFSGSLTYRQLGYWRDDETLWRYTLSIAPYSGIYGAQQSGAGIGENRDGPMTQSLSSGAATALHEYPPGQIVALANYEVTAGPSRRSD